jgi:hypothetical protein
VWQAGLIEMTGVKFALAYHSIAPSAQASSDRETVRPRSPSGGRLANRFENFQRGPTGMSAFPPLAGQSQHKANRRERFI